MTSTAPLLQAHHVRKSFGSVNALLDAHLDVYPGEVVGLVGDNAAGESTLIKVLHEGDGRAAPRESLAARGARRRDGRWPFGRAAPGSRCCQGRGVRAATISDPVFDTIGRGSVAGIPVPVAIAQEAGEFKVSAGPAAAVRHFEDGFGVPCWTDNEVNLMAVGEYLARLGRPLDMIFVKIGRGIGAGIISGGGCTAAPTVRPGKSDTTQCLAARCRAPAVGSDAWA